MENKYQVKIDDSVMPELYTFDQLIDEGLLDEIDEKIKVRLNGEDVWQTARSYPFADKEKNTELPHNSTRESKGTSQFSNCEHNASSTQHTDYECHNRNVQQDIPMYPSIVDKWNWGAFCLSWIWGLFNGLYWPLIIVVFNFIPYIGVFLSICICFYLGKRGNMLAWMIAERKGLTVKHYIDIQKKWNIVGILFFPLLVCFVITSCILLFL